MPHPQLEVVLEETLSAAAGAGASFSSERDAKGNNLLVWVTLADAADLLPVAALLKGLGARLMAVTALSPDRAAPAEARAHMLDYHFDIEGAVLTLRLTLPPKGRVPSLTGLFAGADWHERDFVEQFGIALVGHPDLRPLFVDPSLGPAVLDRLIPFSTMVNAASTKGLWESLLAARRGRTAP